MNTVSNEPTPIGEKNERPDEYVPDGTRFVLSDVVQGRRWRHYRGDVYTTDGVSRWSSNGPDEGRAVVEYRNEHDDKCARFATEFLDGRFRPVEDTELTMMRDALDKIQSIAASGRECSMAPSSQAYFEDIKSRALRALGWVRG